MEGCDAMLEETEEMGEVFGGRGTVAEDDDGFGEVEFGEQEHVEIMFAVGDGDLEMHVFECSGDGQGLCINLT